jgi:hypothetical protein
MIISLAKSVVSLLISSSLCLKILQTLELMNILNDFYLQVILIIALNEEIAVHRMAAQRDSISSARLDNLSQR